MRPRLLIVAVGLLFVTATNGKTETAERPERGPKKVYVLPIRQDIMPTLLYVVRRGVKEAMQGGADLLVLDMDTDGGRVDVTEDIIQILNQFKGETATFVEHRAFSAGSFIAAATQHIFMAPQSVIGAAAPIMLTPGGGVSEMPNTVEAKITSGISALVRATAQKNGHNVDVLEAMVDKNKVLKIDGKVLCAKGEILTLTNTEAAQKYGDPPKPLLSEGTVPNLKAMLAKLGYADAQVTRIQPTGVEQLAKWIEAISPLLLMIGIIGLVIEFKTPGFGIPGIVGLIAFAIYFLGGYVAGLSGIEWIGLFVLGLLFIGLELFLFPGTMVLALIGGALVVVSLLMAMVDMYPGGPVVPTMPQLELPLRQLAIAVVGAAVVLLVIGRFLPKSALHAVLVSHGASGMASVKRKTAEQATDLGRIGKTVSRLCPGGKARFDDRLVDVISQGELVPPGTTVKIVGFSGSGAIVEVIEEQRRA